MSGSIPETQVDHLAVNFDGDGIVVKDGGDIFSWEFVLRVADCGDGYLIRTQVFPTAPSPTMTNLIDVGSSIIIFIYQAEAIQSMNIIIWI